MKKKLIKSATLLMVSAAFFSGNCTANDEWADHPDWVGSWSFSKEVTGVFGFEGLKENSSLPRSIRIECLVSKEAAAKVLGKEMLQSIETFVDRMGHQIQAAGQIIDRSKGAEGSMFFLTWKEGSQFIWLGDPSETINMAKVHYIRGASRDKDALIFDFGGVFKEPQRDQKFSQRLQAFGYRR